MSPAERLAGAASPLVIVLVLTVVAGFLDAFSLTALTGTFIANQTGNTVLIGIGMVDGKSAQAWPPAVAAAAFVGGALASQLVGGGAARSRRARLLAAEALLIGTYLAVALGSVGTTAAKAAGSTLFFLIVLSSASMGLQTAIVTHARGAGVSTTFTSGMLAEIGHLVGGLVATQPGERRDPELRASVVGLAIATYIAGAAFGAFGAEHGTLWLLAPLGALLVLLLAGRVARA